MQLLINGMIAGSLGALVAGGLAFVYGYLGAFNLALGQFALIGGYITWWLHVIHGWPLLASVPIALLIVILLSLFTYEVCVAHFKKFHPFLPLLTTIAFSMILDGLILLVFGESPRAIIYDKHPIAFGDVAFNGEQVMLVTMTLMCLTFLAWILHRTILGRQIRASVQHGYAAESIGISPRFLTRLLFIGSGVLAALGGIFLGIDQILTPTLGFTITIKAYAAVIAGGKQHFAGPILCAYILGFLEQLAVGIPWLAGAYIPAGFQASVALIVIIVFLSFRPQGLFGQRLRIV